MTAYLHLACATVICATDPLKIELVAVQLRMVILAPQAYSSEIDVHGSAMVSSRGTSSI